MSLILLHTLSTFPRISTANAVIGRDMEILTSFVLFKMAASRHLHNDIKTKNGYQKRVQRPKNTRNTLFILVDTIKSTCLASFLSFSKWWRRPSSILKMAYFSIRICFIKSLIHFQYNFKDIFRKCGVWQRCEDFNHIF